MLASHPVAPEELILSHLQRIDAVLRHYAQAAKLDYDDIRR